MRILLIEDDEVISQFVANGFREAGYTVLQAFAGNDGLDLALNEHFDIAVVDLMLPEIDGLSIIERMREQHVMAPVIILSAKRSVDDRVLGLRKGGDDYMTKPFSFAELLARVDAMLRRLSDVQPSSQLQVLDLDMDLLARKVTRAGKRIDLQPKEFALLEYLIRNSGQVVSKTMIMERVWNYNFDPCTNVVEARISKLREKIDKNFGVPLIHTVRGSGYVLRAEP
jgi:two-component system OmpR family response regulator